MDILLYFSFKILDISVFYVTLHYKQDVQPYKLISYERDYQERITTRE